MAKAGESEPASPGESEKPVPSVRIVTRLSEEHVTPEKEEQGFGAVKSQEEKKSVPGMSVREFLIASRATKSTGFRDNVAVAWRKKRRRRKRKGDCE